MTPCAIAEQPTDLHRYLLEIAAKQQDQRVKRFAGVRLKDELAALQSDLREKLLRAVGGLPEAKGPPPVQKLGEIDGGDYVIEKLVYESLPGYFVSALLYKPKDRRGPLPAILSPCGHSTVGKAAATYQMLHINSSNAASLS
jgi:hypothetical protein